MSCHRTPPGEILLILDRCPSIPASEIIQSITSPILDLVPFQNWYADTTSQPFDVKYLTKVYIGLITTDMGRHKHRYNGDSVRDQCEVYEIHLRLGFLKNGGFETRDENIHRSSHRWL
jgi:hypothetical protein